MIVKPNRLRTVRHATAMAAFDCPADEQREHNVSMLMAYAVALDEDCPSCGHLKKLHAGYVCTIDCPCDRTWDQ